jgi:hypothetical protein
LRQCIGTVPTPRAPTREEILAFFHDEFVLEDDTPLMFSIVFEDNYMQALEGSFQEFPTSSGPATVPQVLVHSAVVKESEL